MENAHSTWNRTAVDGPRNTMRDDGPIRKSEFPVSIFAAICRPDPAPAMRHGLPFIIKASTERAVMRGRTINQVRRVDTGWDTARGRNNSAFNWPEVKLPRNPARTHRPTYGDSPFPVRVAMSYPDPAPVVAKHPLLMESLANSLAKFARYIKSMRAILVSGHQELAFRLFKRRRRVTRSAAFRILPHCGLVAEIGVD